MKFKFAAAALTFALAIALSLSGAQAQQTTLPGGTPQNTTPTPSPTATVPPAAASGTTTQTQTRPRTAGQSPSSAPAVAPPGERLEPDDENRMRADVPVDIQANRREMRSEEETAILPYYNNFLSDYRLGPEDVISITVFGQPNYSRGGIVVPPTGIISHQLIPGGIFVGGKNTTQVENEMKAKLEEYIIDPIVTVSLDKPMSARFSVLGDVATPGVRVITRRLSVYEAIAEAGGVTRLGNKKKVYVLRMQPGGRLAPIPVNLKNIERGRAADMVYIVAGDQIVVPGNIFKKIDQVTSLLSVLSFARLFTGGF